MARVIVSPGILHAFAVEIACLNLGFESGSLPPDFAATINSLITLVKTFPRLASRAAFLCLIVDHLLCPDINSSVIIIIENEITTLKT